MVIIIINNVKSLDYSINSTIYLSSFKTRRKNISFFHTSTLFQKCVICLCHIVICILRSLMDIWLTRFGFGVYIIYDNKGVMSFVILFVCYKWYFFNLLYSCYFDTLIVRLRLINLQFGTI